MLEQLIQQDQELFLYLNGLGTTTWDGFWMTYTTKIYWAPLYAVLLYLMFKKYNSKAFVLSIVTIALMVAFTDQITNLFKNHIALRPRPCFQDGIVEHMRLVKSYCGARYGYFSGHSSNSMAVAVFSGLILAYKYKKLIYVLIPWALLMGYSRIYVGVHYPLDVISGGIFGAFSGFIFHKLNNYLHKRFSLNLK